MKFFKRLLTVALIVMSVVAISVPALAAKTAVSGTRYITSQNGKPVNVRKGPGTSYALAAIGTMSVGTKVTLQYKDTGADGKVWYQVINSSNKGGWVRGDFLTSSSPTQVAYETRYGTRTYSKSSTCYELFKNVQRDLKLWFEKTGRTNYACYPLLEADGIFGNATEVAVVEFQQTILKNASDCDGIVGPRTKEALFRETEPWR